MKRDYLLYVKVVIVFLSIVAVYALYYLFLYSGFTSAVDSSGSLVGVRSGTFGDAFGVLNALFSGMAFASVIVTIYLQRKDISDGRHEIARQQSESARQQEESQFYSMLNLQQGVVHGFDLQKIYYDASGGRTNAGMIHGRDCFKTWVKQLSSSYIGDCTSVGITRIQVAYDKLWDNHRGDLSIYYRSLYNLFRFVSSARHADKKWLGSVVRSLVSDYELVILFYNCLSERGGKFKLFANEFAIFDNLDIGLLLDPLHALELDRAAFGQNEEALKLFPN